jgi:hypothetical protein
MSFISLTDIKTYNILSIDKPSLTLRIEVQGEISETRLKPYMAEVLYGLFNKHPEPLLYDEIVQLLKNHHLIISDPTRMHRKLSEIRNFLTAFHTSCANYIANTRGIGYNLPLRLKNLHQTEHKDQIEFKNPKITKIIINLHHLINDAINLTEKSQIIRHSQGYVMNRSLIKECLVENIRLFNDYEKLLMKEICMHEADLTSLRLTYFLAKLKTYISLARISEYPISQTQWKDWFVQEVWALFQEIKALLKLIETETIY